MAHFSHAKFITTRCGGVSLTDYSGGVDPCVLSQKVEEINTETHYTFVVKTRGNEPYVLTTNDNFVTEKEFDVGRVKLQVDKKSKWVKIILFSGALDIEYADLFEGDEPFAHVKEPKAIALQRCYEYFYSMTGDGLCHFGYAHSYGDSASRILNLPVHMRSTPTVSHYKITGLYSRSNSFNMTNDMNVQIFAHQSTHCMVVKFTRKNGSVFPTNNHYELYTAENFWFSCEPL